MKGINHMKYLKIDNGKGFYCLEPENWIELDRIDKDNLLALLDKAINEDFEMDEYDTETLQNKAHQIIYNNLYQKFNELISNKSRFKDESEQLYKSAIEKYTKAISNESAE